MSIARQCRHRLPTLHLSRGDCRARRQVDHHNQPVACVNTIAPDGPSGTALATTDLTSKPDCTDSELISRVVASVCLQPGPLGARHRQRSIQARHQRQARSGRCRFNMPLAPREVLAWRKNWCGGRIADCPRMQQNDSSDDLPSCSKIVPSQCFDHPAIALCCTTCNIRNEVPSHAGQLPIDAFQVNNSSRFRTSER
jgi:hypothetical protein